MILTCGACGADIEITRVQWDANADQPCRYAPAECDGNSDIRHAKNHGDVTW
ncbi:hypothetical protein AB0J38_00220 [Streptomyces sp. NPDC050095]|uniref:hypothetical protein n=1 Tax=unclassified Streptomyces TaxID=2593676 RepID=UPI00344ABBEE